MYQDGSLVMYRLDSTNVFANQKVLKRFVVKDVLVRCICLIFPDIPSREPKIKSCPAKTGFYDTIAISRADRGMQGT